MEENPNSITVKNPENTGNDRTVKAISGNNRLPISSISKDIANVLIDGALNGTDNTSKLAQIAAHARLPSSEGWREPLTQSQDQGRSVSPRCNT